MKSEDELKTGQINTKPYTKSKTLWFNLLAFALIAISSNLELIQAYLSEGGYLLLMMMMSAVNVYLRTVTTQGVVANVTAPSNIE